MEWSVIRNKEDFKRAYDRIIALGEMPNLQENEELFKEFELFALLIEKYESEMLPPVKTDPIRQIKFAMQERNLTAKDMTAYLGSLSKVSEVLSYKRPLSLAMIRRVHNGLGIPYSLLVEPYPLQKHKTHKESVTQNLAFA